MVAPKRGCTFDSFVDLASTKFHIDVKENYDDTLWKEHSKVGCTALDHILLRVLNSLHAG